ncbi:WD40-repeat-containing domain protein [Armillaria luteobubalina]|uniref:WD40-repeat-containing domain protein n=1 Tax=Armillaria luteobubalina TaxID=153913 RepID=A0AA39QND8_9AGAR|nr:WD40-repeat-containing domain protein [Armillaria luteobubalina]KAK0505494.1 WD40-repeat-containing domain protein [Armillaria luteobubalina]
MLRARQFRPDELSLWRVDIMSPSIHANTDHHDEDFPSCLRTFFAHLGILSAAIIPYWAEQRKPDQGMSSYPTCVQLKATTIFVSSQVPSVHSMMSLLQRLHDFMKNSLAPPEECYHIVMRLTGSSASVNSLSFSADGELLASGDDAELIHIYDTHTGKTAQVIENTGESWGQISSIAWLPSLNQTSKSLALSFGTGRGLVAIYKRAKNSRKFQEAFCLSPFPSSDIVETLSYDPCNALLVVSSQHGEIKLYNLDWTSWTLNSVWMTKLKNTILRSMHFVDEGRQLIIFCLESKEMICIMTEDRKPNVKWIGSAILFKGHHLLIDNLMSGFDLYAFLHLSTSRTFPVPMTLERSIIKDAVFAEDGQVVVCGSDHGLAYVFSRSNREKKPLQIMHHGKEHDYLQVVAVRRCFIAHLNALTNRKTGCHSIGSAYGRHWIIWMKWERRLVGEAKRDLADTKDKIELLIFVFVIWASWSYLPALSDIGLHCVSWDVLTDSCEGVGLVAPLGALRDGLLFGYGSSPP